MTATARFPRIAVVVQARFGSRRLPGKVLRPMFGQPMLGHLLDGLLHSKSVDGIVLATSNEAEDDPVAKLARERGVDCFRGVLDDVAARIQSAAQSVRATAIVRVSGDSPLLDPRLVDQAVDIFRAASADLVSNVQQRTFPKGQSVEVMTCAALARARAAMTTAYDREHVTPFFYAHPAAFVIRSFAARVPRPDLELSVNEPADFIRCERILALLGRPHWEAGWEECARMSDLVDSGGFA